MVSLIFPTFNEEENLEELYKRLASVVSHIPGQEFEFVFIDDCSTDGTPEILRQLRQEDRRIKIIRFARNCGSHAALTAGLTYCLGDCAIVMAADLQDPPEIITSLLDKWRIGAKTVWGVRKKRKGESIVRQFCSRMYYRMMNSLTAVKTPPSGADVFLVDRVVIEAFRQVSEKHTSVFMALAWLGFPQSSIEYVKEKRFKGDSKWSLASKIKLTIDSLLSFSDIPIRYISVWGFLTALLGFIYAVLVGWGYFFEGSSIKVWSPILIVILVIGGVQMMMLGILGEYLWRTFDESRKRPRFVIEYKID